MWTLFWDMHSGGSQKEPWAKIYIEAEQETAIKVFYNRFGHNPYRVTCTCCGEDYSVSESETLEQISGYHRGCAYGKTGYIEAPSTDKWRKYLTVEQYAAQPDVLIIRADEIKPEEKEGDVPTQGYVWLD